jgi:hypothetical protein
MATRAAKNAAMCCVSIDHNDFLLPADKGMKLVELLQHAVCCDRHYESRDYSYKVHDAPAVEFYLVKPSQIVMPQGKRQQLALEGPTK